MIPKVAVAAAVLLFAAPASPAVVADPITGRWMTGEGHNGQGIIAIGRCGNALCGTLVEVLSRPAGAPAVDANNPDPKLRKRPLVGTPILTGFTDAGRDWRGTIYDPSTGKSYRSIVRVDGDSLSVKGCLVILCRTQTWLRVR